MDIHAYKYALHEITTLIARYPCLCSRVYKIARIGRNCRIPKHFKIVQNRFVKSKQINNFFF